MYTDEPGPSSSQNNAKSCIQALLRNREQNLISRRSPLNNFHQEPSYFINNLDVPSELTDTDIVSSQDCEQPTGYYNNTEADCLEPLDNQNDFNYSQKLFHIADGNLYSIFSPIQGRSYGMKPSFLRKQKYTVQECHTRGRKNLRKGLKFHNFLPSESVTSEKDNGYLRTKWKVHSECRLKEEHGTKQITISNWSQSVQNSSSDSPVGSSKQPSVKSDSTVRLRTDNASKQASVMSSFLKNHQSSSSCSTIPNNNIDPYDFSLSLQSNSFPNTSTFTKDLNESVNASKIQNVLRPTTSKKDSLNSVLSSLLDRPEVSENQINTCDRTESSSNSPSPNQKHRRKPLQTRRVVPYVQYLSIMEENEGVPLDLSAKYGPEGSDMQFENKEVKHISGENVENYLNSLTNGASFIQTHNDIASGSSTNSNYPSSDIFQNSSTLGSLLQNQTPLMFLSPSINSMNIQQPFPSPVGKMPQEMANINGKLSLALNAKQIRIKNSYPLNMNVAHSSANNIPFSVHKSLIKESQSRTRRRNQRSVIKQKLEDTFKQNGFLVKTKQVSDGEATFCKFRQLRKYTRYYLKSWQHHLPDEVNKMWKGFLPPKTVLPPASSSTGHTDGAP